MINPDIKIAMITYNVAHRKTQDLLFQLKAKGYKEIQLMALPFVNRPNPFKPIYSHRPSKAIPVTPEELSIQLNYGFQTVTADSLVEDIGNYQPDYVLVAGAGLLPDELVETYKIINTHPGWLPKVRGLDSLKWAIVNQQPIGITTHFIDTEADAGFLIEQKEIPVYASDTFHALAYRQYETEIEMLAGSIEIIPGLSEFKSLSNDEYLPTRRMPKDIEKTLLDAFEAYKEKFAVS